MTLARITRLFSLTVSAVGLCALAHAQTAVQFGINRGTSPNQIGVYDSANVFQPFMTMPATGGGPLTTLPSTTAKSGFNIAPGVAPTSPNNGDMWTTNGGLYVQINGGTIGPLSETGSGSFAATFPLVVSFSEGVATYSLNYDPAYFTLSGNNLTPAASGVTAGTYGDATHSTQVTFDAKGRATSASSVAINIPASAVSGLGTFATQNYATPPAIGATTPNSGAFTTLTSRQIATAVHVATESALAATAGYSGAVVIRDGYASAGDGGNATYIYSAAACSLNSGSGDGGSQVAATGGGCWVASFSATGADVRVWGVVNDGSTVNTTTLQNAISWAIANSATLLIPSSGAVVFSSTINLNAGSPHIVGEGIDGATLEPNFGNADAILFSGSVFDGSVENLRILNTSSSFTSGCEIDSTNGTGDNRAIKVRIQNGWNGICMNNATAVTGVLSIDKIDISGVSNDSIYINNASQFFMSDTDTSTCGGAGVHIIAAGGLYFNNDAFGGCKQGLLINPGTGNNVFDGFINNFEVDSSNGSSPGVDFDSTGGGSIYNFRMTNIRSGFGDGAGYGFSGSNTSNINLVNFSSERNLHEGILVGNLQNSSFSHGQLLGNSVGSTGYPGINLEQGNDIKIEDVHSTYAYPGQANSNQTYGAVIENTFTGTLSLLNNDFTNNATGALANLSTDTSIIIEGNDGYNPVGVTYPTLGASPWTFTNGPTPAMAILQGGTCTSVKVGGFAMPASGSQSLLLAPNQVMTGTCSINPNFYLMVQ